LTDSIYSTLKPHQQPSKLQAQAVLFDLQAKREADRTRRFVLRFGAVLLRAHDRLEQGEHQE